MGNRDAVQCVEEKWPISPKKEETGRKFSPTVKDLRPDAATALYVLCSMRGVSGPQTTRIKGVGHYLQTGTKFATSNPV